MCGNEFGPFADEDDCDFKMQGRFNIAQLEKTRGYNKALQNWTAVTEQSLAFLYPHERSIFFAVYLAIYIVAVIGNLAAIFVTIKRKHRSIQKSCIISLALSDLVTATAIVVMYLSVFSEPIIIWTLGSFLCSFLPAVPLFGVVCSSAVLVGIALDRYRNVIHALKRRWNPDTKWCVLGVIFLWTSAAGIAYPMYTFFESVPIYVIYFDHTNTIPLDMKEARMCITFLKEDLQVYHISLMGVVFIPLLLIFLWLYYKVAKLIWKHRKPLSSIFRKKTETSTTVETSTTQTRASEECSRSTATNSDLQLKSVMKSRNARVERKIRTFKIIIFLMFTFLVMRLPNFFDTVKLTGTYTKHGAWVAKYASIALVLLNCALNPFLYTFLNQTLDTMVKIAKTIKDFTCKVCCCCFSNAEFEEFENDNPFVRESFEKRVQNNESDSSSMCRAKQKNSRVKFENQAFVQHYYPEPDTSQESYKEFKKY